MNGSLLTTFWSQPAKSRGRSKDNSSICDKDTSLSDTSAQSRRTSEGTRQRSCNSGQNTRESHPRLRSHGVEKKARTTSISITERNKMKIRNLLQSRKGRSSKTLDERKEKSVKYENIFSYPVVGRAYEMPDEVKDELDTMACNEDTVRLVYVNLY
jgi:hypothetical protein